MVSLEQRCGRGPAGVVDLAGGEQRSGMASDPLTRRRIDIDHRGGVLMRGEGQGPLPVERVLRRDRLVERGRARGGIASLRVPEPQPVAALIRPPPQVPAQPGSRATPASTRMRLTWMRPRQGPKPWSLTIITAAPRRSASSQSMPMASSRPRITSAAAAFHSGASIPVSSTFRYGQTRC